MIDLEGTLVNEVVIAVNVVNADKYLMYMEILEKGNTGRGDI